MEVKILVDHRLSYLERDIKEYYEIGYTLAGPVIPSIRLSGDIIYTATLLREDLPKSITER